MFLYIVAIVNFVPMATEKTLITHVKLDKVNISCKDQLGQKLFVANDVFMTIAMVNIFTIATKKKL